MNRNSKRREDAKTKFNIVRRMDEARAKQTHRDRITRYAYGPDAYAYDQEKEKIKRTEMTQRKKERKKNKGGIGEGIRKEKEWMKGTGSVRIRQQPC